jgi:hypothetical protein
MKGRRPGLQRMEAWARPTVVLVVPRVTSRDDGERQKGAPTQTALVAPLVGRLKIQLKHTLLVRCLV